MDTDYQLIHRTVDQSMKYYYAKKYYPSLQFQKALIVSSADMQFKFSPQIYKKYMQKMQNIHFGYPNATKSFWAALQNWIKQRYYKQAKLNPQNTLLWNNTVNSFSSIIQYMVKQNQQILIMCPTYYMFIDIAKYKNRKIIQYKLETKDNRLFIDFDKLEDIIKSNDIKLLAFINPWNPCGRIWSKEQLKKLANLAVRYQFYLLSDQIYADSVQPTEQQINEGLTVKDIFTSMLVIQQSHPYLIYISSYTKAFNASGIALSYSICFDKDLNKKLDYFRIFNGNFIGASNIRMLETIYTCQQAKDWKINTNKYVRANFELFKQLCKQKLPLLYIYDLQCSYLVLVDFAKYNIKGKTLQQKFVKLNVIPTFMESAYFTKQERSLIRLNLAMNKQLIKQLVQRMAEVIKVQEKQK